MNNVGVLAMGAPETLPDEAWMRAIDINLFSIARSNRVFLPGLIAQGSGHVVNTASASGLLAYGFDRLPYVASKHAIVGLSEALAIYLGPKGIGVTCLCPSGVITNILEQITVYGDATATPRAPAHPIVAAEDVGKLTADAVEDGTFLVVTAPEMHELSSARQRHRGLPPGAHQGARRERAPCRVRGPRLPGRTHGPQDHRGRVPDDALGPPAGVPRTLRGTGAAYAPDRRRWVPRPTSCASASSPTRRRRGAARRRRRARRDGAGRDRRDPQHHPSETCRRLQADFPHLHFLDARCAEAATWPRATAARDGRWRRYVFDRAGRCSTRSRTRSCTSAARRRPGGEAAQQCAVRRPARAGRHAFSHRRGLGVDLDALTEVLSAGSGRSYAAEVVAGSGHSLSVLAELAGGLLAKDVGILADVVGQGAGPDSSDGTPPSMPCISTIR